MKHYTLNLTEDELSAVGHALDTFIKNRPHFMLIGEVKEVAERVSNMIDEIDEVDDGR